MGVYRFSDGAEFDTTSGELRRAGVVIRLEPQPAAVLALLAARAGQIVTHDEIRQAVWGKDRHVSFQESIHYCVRQVRLALGDAARTPRFLESLPRRGYRLREDALARVAPSPAERSGPAERATSLTKAKNASWVPAGRRRRLVLAFATVVLAASVIGLERRPNNHHEMAIAVLQAVHDAIF